jgi:hypothetical protein
MAEFSYDSSIAPMKGNFFSDVAASRGLTTGAASYLASKYTTEVDPYVQSQIKTQEDMLKSQYQQIAFKRQQLDLMSAADEAKAQREALETLPNDLQIITGIVNDPSKNSFEKLSAVGQYKMENSGRLTRNKSLINLVSSAEDTLRNKDETEKQKTALGYALATQGLPEAVKGVFGGDVSEGTGKQYYEAAAAINKQQEDSAKSSAKYKSDLNMREEEEKARTQQMTGQLAFLNRNLAQLDQMAAAKEEEGYAVGSLKDGSAKAPVSKNGVPQAAPFTFKPEDKVQLEEIIRTQNPMIEDADLSKYTSEQLYRNAYRSTTGAIKRLVGIPTSGIADKFK